MTQLYWLRNDLRSTDNTALNAAMANGPTVALYVLSPAQWQAHHDSPNKVDFWLRNLHALRDELNALGVPLLIRQVEHWQDIGELLLTLCQQLQVRAVQVNAEYGVNETRRDQSVAACLARAGVAWHSHLDQLLFAPGSLLTQSGQCFQVYSQFRKACYRQLARHLPTPLPRPRAQPALPLASDPLPEQVSGFARPTDSLRQLWPAGEQQALQRLQRFAEERLEDYDRQRDLPALPGTSQLSPYLAAGVLSPRQCLHAALQHNQSEFESGNPGVVCWINELLWREFYKHILVAHPRLSMGRAFRRETEAVAWRDAPHQLLAWQEGRTGFPLIDAAMQQLRATGWMHNRLRMVVAMFLCKNLLIDWRHGERFFMEQLIDGDLAANNGGWQWSASTGTDAVPYFRLFNPITQSQRFDPDGTFIRHWLPALAGLNKRDIHDPARLGGLFGIADYPRPLVDLAASRSRALAAFKALERSHE